MKYLILFLLAGSSLVFAQPGIKKLSFDKSAAVQMVADDAIETAAAFVGWGWMETRIANCNNLPAVISRQAKLRQEKLKIRFSELSHIQEITAMLHSAIYKRGEMDCSIIINTTGKANVRETAQALWRLKQADGQQLVDEYLIKRQHAINNAPLRDRFLELLLNFKQAKSLAKKIAEEFRGQAKGNKQYARPKLIPRSFTARSVNIFSAGKMTMNYRWSIAPKKNGGFEYITHLTSINPFMAAGKNQTEITGKITTAEYELPIADMQMSGDYKVLQVKTSYSAKPTELKEIRKNIQRSGQAGFLPATVAVPMVLEQRFKTDLGILGNRTTESYRSCVALGEESVEVAGQFRPSLVFDCVLVEHQEQVARRIPNLDFDPEKHKVTTLNKSLFTIYVSLEHGLPLKAEMVVDSLVAGNGTRSNALYQVLSTTE